VSPASSGCICAPPCINPAKKPTDPPGTCPPYKQPTGTGITEICDISRDGKLPALYCDIQCKPGSPTSK
jgi:hypothetical protein